MVDKAHVSQQITKIRQSLTSGTYDIDGALAACDALDKEMKDEKPAPAATPPRPFPTAAPATPPVSKPFTGPTPGN